MKLGIVLITILLLVDSYSATAAADVNINDLLQNLQDIEEIMDAYNRGDYVGMGMKLIDIKFKINPPEQYSNEQLQLLIARRLFGKMHPYYLFLNPKKRPVEGANDFRDKINTGQFSLEDYVKPIGQAINVLDYGTQQAAVGIDTLLQIGGTLIDKITQPTTEENDLYDTEYTNEEPEKVVMLHKRSVSTEDDQQQESNASLKAMSSIFSAVAKTAIITAEEAMEALISYDVPGFPTSLDSEMNGEEESEPDID